MKKRTIQKWFNIVIGVGVIVLVGKYSGWTDDQTMHSVLFAMTILIYTEVHK